jgi:hypothetical protein
MDTELGCDGLVVWRPTGHCCGMALTPGVADQGPASLGRAASIRVCLLATVVRLLVGAHGAATLSSARVAYFCGRGCINLLCHRQAVDD